MVHLMNETCGYCKQLIGKEKQNVIYNNAYGFMHERCYDKWKIEKDKEDLLNEEG